VSVQFTRLRVSGWRQFGDVDLDLTSRLTILTGANGAGKTTLVTLLGRHFNWSATFLGLPVRSKSGQLTYSFGIRRSLAAEANPSDPWIPIGQLYYSNGQVTPISVYEQNSPQSDVHLPDQQTVPGLFLSSHRSLSSYQQVQSIPAQFSASETILDQYQGEIRQRYFGVGYSQKSTMLLMKESLLAAAIYSQGNDAVQASPEAAEVWAGFQDCLRLLLPESLKFRRLGARPPEVIVETDTGDFMIDAVSGGLSALLDLGWQVYLRSRQFSDFTVCMDEPENHLHPSLQRSILPSTTAALGDLRRGGVTRSGHRVIMPGLCGARMIKGWPRAIA